MDSTRRQRYRQLAAIAVLDEFMARLRGAAA
jgi:hypothetical protein